MVRVRRLSSRISCSIVARSTRGSSPVRFGRWSHRYPWVSHTSNILERDTGRTHRRQSRHPHQSGVLATIHPRGVLEMSGVVAWSRSSGADLRGMPGRAWRPEISMDVSGCQWRCHRRVLPGGGSRSWRFRFLSERGAHAAADRRAAVRRSLPSARTERVPPDRQGGPARRGTRRMLPGAGAGVEPVRVGPPPVGLASTEELW